MLLQIDPPAEHPLRASPRQLVSEPGRSSSFYWLIASGFYLLATLSKPTAIVLPLMVGSLGLLRPEFSPRRIWKWMLLWLVLSIPCIYMTLHVQPFRGDPLAPWKRPVVALDSLAFYLYKIVWPASLTIDYGRTPNSIFIAGYARWTWIVPVLVLIFLWLKNNRVLWCAAILFVAPILLVLGLIPFDFQWLSTVGDRYMYLSFFGVALAVAWALGGRDWATPIVMILIAALAIRSWFQVWKWRDSMSLLTHAISVNPRSFVGLNNLAVLYDHAGNPQRELELLDQALVVKPHAVLARLGRSVALAKLDRWDEAVENYRIAFATTPKPIAFEVTRLAGLYGKEGHIKEGLIYGKLAVELAPQSAQAHLFYGSTLGEAGRRDEAIAQLQKAIELQPDNVVTQCNLATMLAGERRFDEAAARYNAALKLQPRLPAALEGLRRLDAFATPGLLQIALPHQREPLLDQQLGGQRRVIDIQRHRRPARPKRKRIDVVNVDLRRQQRRAERHPRLTTAPRKLDSEHLGLIKTEPACSKPLAAQVWGAQISRTSAVSADSSIAQRRIFPPLSSSASKRLCSRPTRLSKNTVNCRTRVSSNPAPSNVCGGNTSSIARRLYLPDHRFPTQNHFIAHSRSRTDRGAASTSPQKYATIEPCARMA